MRFGAGAEAEPMPVPIFICRSVTIRYKSAMNKIRPISGFAMLASILLSATVATAQPALPPALAAGPAYQMAQVSCDGAARQVVASTGGQLLSVSPSGNGACQVTVLVPGQGDERPRKKTVTVPAS